MLGVYNTIFSVVRITYTPASRSILVAPSANMGVQSISLPNLLDMLVDPLVLSVVTSWHIDFCYSYLSSPPLPSI